MNRKIKIVAVLIGIAAVSLAVAIVMLVVDLVEDAYARRTYRDPPKHDVLRWDIDKDCDNSKGPCATHPMTADEARMVAREAFVRHYPKIVDIKMSEPCFAAAAGAGWTCTAYGDLEGVTVKLQGTVNGRVQDDRP
jgi:hypothetical protein